MTTMTEPLLYKVRTAMTMLDVSRTTIYRMVKRGELDIVPVGTHGTRITAASLERVAQAVRKQAG